MKQFNTFGEYMFDLLFAPLKKGRRAVNQFSIFFRVIGREFDDLKAMIFRVRNEANVASASEVMLPVHGQDRDMPRLEGEDTEAYRTRLSMKGIISEWSGTRRGILYVLTALGYEHSSITPVCQQDPDRWAEFIVDLGVGNTNAVKSFYAIFREIQRVKEGSSRVAGIVFTMRPVYTILRLGGGVSAVAQLGLPQNADKYDFQQTIFAGGVIASKSSIGLPQRGDEFDFSATLHAGGTGGIHASAGVHEAGDDFSFQDKVFAGGKFSAMEKMPVPESTAPPPATTILRTGGVCTILSNLSKGE